MHDCTHNGHIIQPFSQAHCRCITDRVDLGIFDFQTAKRIYRDRKWSMFEHAALQINKTNSISNLQWLNHVILPSYIKMYVLCFECQSIHHKHHHKNSEDMKDIPIGLTCERMTRLGGQVGWDVACATWPFLLSFHHRQWLQWHARILFEATNQS